MSSNLWYLFLQLELNSVHVQVGGRLDLQSPQNGMGQKLKCNLEYTELKELEPGKLKLNQGNQDQREIYEFGFAF